MSFFSAQHPSDECEWVRDAVRQLQDIVDTRAWEAGWRLDLSAVTRPVVPYEVWQAPAGWPITWPSRWCRPDIPGQLVWTAGSLSPRERDRLRYEEQVRMLQDQLTQAERERDIALKIQHETQERGKALLASLHSFGQAFDQALAEDQTVGGDELVEVRVNARLAKEALAHFQEVNLAEAERILAGEVLPIHDKDPPPPGIAYPMWPNF